MYVRAYRKIFFKKSQERKVKFITGIPGYEGVILHGGNIPLNDE